MYFIYVYIYIYILYVNLCLQFAERRNVSLEVSVDSSTGSLTSHNKVRLYEIKKELFEGSVKAEASRFLLN
jgi:hypothetical protein